MSRKGVRVFPDLSLAQRIDALEDSLFLTQLELSVSRDSGIPTCHPDALHGGAILDDSRRIIVSVSRDCNKGRDVFVTHLTDEGDGTTEVLKDKILFDSHYRFPIYDGSRFVYFREMASGGGCGKRFGRLDLDTFSFKELPAISIDIRDNCFAGCYHRGVIYMIDTKCRLCGFNTQIERWDTYGIEIPVFNDGNKFYGRLLSDPQDPTHLYYIGFKTKNGLYKIDLDANTVTLLSRIPLEVDEYDTILIRNRPQSDGFVIILSVTDGSWHMYSSRTKTWKALSKWKGKSLDYIKDYLVFSQSTKTFYYHIHGNDTWETVQL